MKNPHLQGRNNKLWKGDNASYSAFHRRLHRARGMPKKCEICGLDDLNAIYHWANLTGKFYDLNDYKRMCIKCHRNFDRESYKKVWETPHKSFYQVENKIIECIDCKVKTKRTTPNQKRCMECSRKAYPNQYNYRQRQLEKNYRDLSTV